MNCNTIMDDISNEYMNKTEFSKQFDSICASGNKLKIVNLLVEKYNCDFDDARMVCDYFIDGTPLPSDLSPQQQAHNNAVAQEWLNKPKCPTCGSINIKKISGTSKVAGAVAFGLFSKTARSQFKCENCGYKW